MIRPVGNPARPSADASDRELEADVMRFVAILALCIVAISTLVDRAPSAEPAPQAELVLPAPAAHTEPVPDPTDSPMVPAPPASPPASASARAGGAVPITPPRAAPSPASVPAPPPPARAAERVADPVPPIRAPQRLVRLRPTRPAAAPPSNAPTPAAKDAATPPETAPAPAPTPTASAAPAEPPVERGFTLRFASDAALLRLVARGSAEVFVFHGPETLKLAYGPAGAAFAPAPGPGQYHAIAATTVPDLLRRAWSEVGPADAGVVWGVTLPAATRASLAQLIRNHDSGELVIDERGRVSLEAQDG